jgi:RNA polymerase sigma factor (sigma-70 family)
MGDHDRLAERFESHRSHLRGVAYRMLGSLSEADDAVQEAWLRLSRADTRGVENLAGWLTRVVARVCLDMLGARTARREQPLGIQVPDPIVNGQSERDPEQEALLAEEVGLALLVVLDRLAPAERVAFMLHDLFAMPFEEIAPVLERTPTAAKKLASRARHRVHGNATSTGPDRSRQRHVVDAFLAATRGGDVKALLAVLDPDVVVRGITPAGVSVVVRGAASVAEQALSFARRHARFAQPALVNGAPGVVVAPPGRLFAVMGFTVRRGKIVEIEVVADPARLRQLDLAVLD